MLKPRVLGPYEPN